MPLSARSWQGDEVAEIEIELVDERDSSWEVGPRGQGIGPRFRVYLHSSGAETTHGTTWTYDVTGADVLQVIDWAQRQAGDRPTYAVALVGDDAERERLDPGHGRGLVWLVGMDGNDTALDAEEASTQNRMLRRRTQPVAIPTEDTMPPGVPDPFNDGTQKRPQV